MTRSSGGGNSNEEMRQLAKRMNQLMDEWMHARFRGNPGEAWEPAVDVIECQTYVCILAGLAGMKRSDFDVRFEGRTVTLVGVRRLEDVEGPVQVHQMELPRGPFRRTIQVPFEIPAADVRLVFEAGLLRICMPKPGAASAPELQTGGCDD